MYNQDGNPQIASNVSEDEIDLKELFTALWQGKWAILGAVLTAAVVAIFYALSIPNIYKSEALLAPVEENNGGSLSSLAGQFGGLASLAGINLGGASSGKITIALELLKSRQFLGEFIDENDLKPAIIAAEGWDQSKNTLVYDKDIYELDQQKWVRDVNPPKQVEPSLLEAHQKFLKDNLIVSQDKDSGLVKLSVKHYSPYLAQELVSKLIKAINKQMRQKDIEEAQNSIEYLQKALRKTDVADMQSVFYQLIEKQQQTKMLANVREEYVLKTIDPPVVAEEKSEPKRAIIVILMSILGGIIGSVFSLIKYFRKG
ncbi:Wzz/FepE/Etk N-terminal domain-containing protein [Alteromonas sp. S167]|uniref:Wzz/FepE/Etk N-terminal domain-containing protein n=1 Tax=Alteromonas sp. S167 TaxID=3117402 RepID=UPI002FDFC103